MSDANHDIFIKRITPQDLECFKEHLTEQEMYRFEQEEYKLYSSRLELLKKYNQVVADRLSRLSLIGELQTVLEHSSIELSKLLDEMDNKGLQQLLSVVSLCKKKKEVL